MSNASAPLAALIVGGTDRSMDTMQHKLASFARLAGDAANGVTGGIMAHALRSRSLLYGADR